MSNVWETIVGNIGTVYTGSNGFQARKLYGSYVAQSKAGYGRCGNESVVLMKNHDIHLEFLPEKSLDDRLSEHHIEILGLDASDFRVDDTETWMGERLREVLKENPNYDPDFEETDDEGMEGIIEETAESLAGFYWWCCLPGCMPEGEANGPYQIRDDAAENALEGLED